MQRREYADKSSRKNIFLWLYVLIFVVVFLLVLGQYAKSSVPSDLRSNFVVGTKNGELSLVSYDPSEGKITQLLFDDIEISSRSVGQYKLSQLYGLGAYQSKGFEFAQKKMQGFLRLPITSYLEVEKIGKWDVRKAFLLHIFNSNKSGVSRIDAVKLFFFSMFMEWHTITFENLIREGVVEEDLAHKYQVNDDRLQQFIGQRLFDWQVGAEGMTVALINESGKEGLGSDVAKFILNVGMDVVAVRTGTNSGRGETQVIVSSQDKKSATHSVLNAIFGRDKILYDDSYDFGEYRSQIVILIGTDMQEMF